jgi:hypothetical protein
MTLPPALAAALDAIGVRAPKPAPAPLPVAWKPKHPGDEPPF